MYFLISCSLKRLLKSKKTRKHSLTLLEVIIACALLGILLSVVFGFYRNLLHFKKEYQTKKELSSERMTLRATLLPLFSKIPKPFPAEKIYSLYTSESPSGEGTALYFYFEKDLDPDPNFVGVLQSCIYVNQQKKLVLSVWPKKDGEPREIILMPKVFSVSWHFLGNKTYEWTHFWKKKSEALPLAIKMSLEENRGSFLEYSFLLSQAQKEIIYKANK